jgi:hypothetical protein
MKKIYLFLGIIIAVVLIGGATVVKANPSLFLQEYSDIAGASTSTLAYMTPGTGTTTLTYNNTINGLDSASILIQYTATTTGSPVLKMRVEHSQDGVDWYSEAGILTSNASTTNLTGSFADYQFNIATSTSVIGPSGSVTRINQLVRINTPLKYNRAVFYVPAGGGNGGLWAQLVAKKEQI